ncbi:hypothetical protein L0P88_14335 [Muricauda sp. SCSIO 64092]|uniref:hypothetical protein n=1 Tax=Allomuricauda sp. SCSIO 64092 TaxID=2908842 RepID=UPI001FF3C915|nr:hypothetical protein [Muricauda sp. SCSIO 64092]UOY05121.1 hypothetical protein L0P88_14335 [Muricauda sp. SCSIO 64092]
MKNNFIKTIIIALLLLGCDDDDNGDTSLVFNGSITGGPFTFCVNDGVADNVSDIALGEGSSTGSNSTWIVTDNDNIILSLPSSISELEAINFDVGEPGIRLIWYLSANAAVTNLEVGQDIVNLGGDFDLSKTAVKVNRNATVAAVLSGGPFTFCIDGNEDNVGGITVDEEGSGTNATWVITDGDGLILATPNTLADVEEFDFNEGDPGNLSIWNLQYEDDVANPDFDPEVEGSLKLTVTNANDLSGCFSLSNPITVTRNVSEVSAATILGGPYSFCMDGTADNVNGLDIDESEAVGTNSAWILTDAGGAILQLPASIAEIEAIDFDSTESGGTRLIWNIRYEDGLVGLEVGASAGDLVGCFALSDSIEIQRTITAEPNNAGTISGGPFNFTDDGMPDFVSDIELDDENLVGTNTSWVVTDNAGIILALPATLAELEAINFENINVGSECLIWHMSYEDSLLGLSVFNSANELSGCFALSNSIQVNKN